MAHYHPPNTSSFLSFSASSCVTLINCSVLILIQNTNNHLLPSNHPAWLFMQKLLAGFQKSVCSTDICTNQRHHSQKHLVLACDMNKATNLKRVVAKYHGFPNEHTFWKLSGPRLFLDHRTRCSLHWPDVWCHFTGFESRARFSP